MNELHDPLKRIKIIFTIMLLIIVGLMGLVGYLFFQIYTLKNPESVVAAELNKIVAQVGELIVLPQDEQPTLATVSDPSKLKDQAFFANAEVGDKVLVYPISKKAVLWRPSTKKIIEVSSLNIAGADSGTTIK